MLQTIAITYSVKVIGAILILLIGKWLIARIIAITRRVMNRQDIDTTLTKFLCNVLNYALLAVVVIAAAGQLGINTTSFLTIVGAAGLAIGLALKDSLANFASGVMLILFRPFRVNDVVTVAGETGTVEEIAIFNTILKTADNQRKIIPNGAIANDTITNITANPIRRIDITAGIGYDDDIRTAKQLFEKLLLDDPRILADPAPTVAVSELADSSVNFVVRPWVKTDEYWDVRFDLIENIKLSLDAAGISIPYPQQDIHLHNVADNPSE